MTVVAVLPHQEHFEQTAALFDAYRVHQGQNPDPDAARQWLAAQLTAGAIAAFAATRDGLACGFITCTTMPASLRLGTAWSVRDLYVDPAARRGGVARELLRHVIDAARAEGVHRVALQTEPDNAAALALYAAMGFAPVSGLVALTLPLG